MNKIKYKYYFILPSKKFKIISKNNNLKNIIKETKTKINKNKKFINNTIILLRLTKNIINTQNSLLKIKTGPVKVEIIFYIITKRFAIKIKDDDNRNNFLFYTQKYLEKYKILQKDLQKIAKAAFNKKLETRLMAPKLINQIKKISL